MSSYIALDVYGISDIGTHKQVNEDSFVYKVANIGGLCVGLFAVADGVGGLSNGDWASRTCIGRINRWWENELSRYSGSSDTIDSVGLKNAIIDANSLIRSESEKRRIKSGTTLTMIATYDNKAVIAHVGDTRCYRFRKSFLSFDSEQLTTDHICKASSESGGVNVVKTLLTDCVGYRKEFRIDMIDLELNPGDLYMLCSDGIYKKQSDSDIANCVKRNRKDIETLCKSLVNDAKAKGEKDNISVIALTVDSKGKVN